MCAQLSVVVANQTVKCLLISFACCVASPVISYDQSLSQTVLAETAVVFYLAIASSLRECPAVLYITLSQALFSVSFKLKHNLKMRARNCSSLICVEIILGVFIGHFNVRHI